MDGLEVVKQWDRSQVSTLAPGTFLGYTDIYVCPWGLLAARVGEMYFHLVWEPGPQKVCKYSYIPSATCLMDPQ